jgi:hypothetical protein
MWVAWDCWGSEDDNFFFYQWGETESLGTAATTGLLYLPRMVIVWEIGGMKIGRGNRSIRRKPVPQRHFVHHKSHMTRPGFEPAPPRWEASE